MSNVSVCVCFLTICVDLFTAINLKHTLKNKVFHQLFRLQRCYVLLVLLDILFSFISAIVLLHFIEEMLKHLVYPSRSSRKYSQIKESLLRYIIKLDPTKKTHYVQFVYYSLYEIMLKDFFKLINIVCTKFHYLRVWLLLFRNSMTPESKFTCLILPSSKFQ